MTSLNLSRNDIEGLREEKDETRLSMAEHTSVRNMREISLNQVVQLYIDKAG